MTAAQHSALAQAEAIKAAWFEVEPTPRTRTEATRLVNRWRRSPEARHCWILCARILGSHVAAINKQKA